MRPKRARCTWARYDGKEYEVEVYYSSGKHGVEIEDVVIFDGDVERPDLIDALYTQIAERFYTDMPEPLDIYEDL